MILDTHRFVEELVASGFKKKQAEVIVTRLNECGDNIATKTDIDRLQNKMEKQIAETKYDILKFIILSQLTLMTLLDIKDTFNKSTRIQILQIRIFSFADFNKL